MHSPWLHSSQEYHSIKIVSSVLDILAVMPENSENGKLSYKHSLKTLDQSLVLMV